MDAVKRYEELRRTMNLNDAIVQLQVDILNDGYEKYKTQKHIEQNVDSHQEEEIRKEFGYEGKPKQWQLGFDALLRHLKDYFLTTHYEIQS